MRLKSWLDAALAFFYPEVCQVCGSERAGPEEGYVGVECRAKVRSIEPPLCDRCGRPFEGKITTTFDCGFCRDEDFGFVSARSAVVFSDVVLEVIHRYKYQRALWFEPFLSELLLSQAQKTLNPKEWDSLVPVPLHPVKLREREFNQAERLACHLGKALCIPVASRLLKRVHWTPSQTTMTRAQRLDNVRHAFQSVTGPEIEGKRLVLVDDVFTTGATTSACAKTLISAGAKSVSVWTVARGVS